MLLKIRSKVKLNLVLDNDSQLIPPSDHDTFETHFVWFEAAKVEITNKP